MLRTAEALALHMIRLEATGQTVAALVNAEATLQATLAAVRANPNMAFEPAFGTAMLGGFAEKQAAGLRVQDLAEAK